MSDRFEIYPETDLVLLTLTGQGAQSEKMTEPWRNDYDSILNMEYFKEVTGVDPYIDFTSDQLSSGRVTQPANVLVQTLSTMALYQGGIHPDIVIGHSLGEISGLHAAGWLSAKDAIQLAARRGETTTSVIHNVAERMGISTGMFPMVLREGARIKGTLWDYLSRYGVELAEKFRQENGHSLEEIDDSEDFTGADFIGPSNSNTRDQVILSGTRRLIEYLSENFPENFKKARPLRVDGAFHSRAMSSGIELYRPFVASSGVKEPLGRKNPRYLSPTYISELNTASAFRAMLTNQLRLPVRFYETEVDLFAKKILGEYAVERVVVIENGPSIPRDIDNPETGILTEINRKNLGEHILHPATGKLIPVVYRRISRRSDLLN